MRRATYTLLALGLACGGASVSDTTDGDATTAPETGDGDGESDSGESDESDSGPLLDVSPGDVGPPGDKCKVDGDLDAIPDCDDEAPPDSFEEDVQWSWEGDSVWDQVIATPLVGNLTDDDENGEIDLCDVPDIVVPVLGNDDIWYSTAFVYALDGETGAVHWQSERAVWGGVNPALGDIDADGIPEIITIASPSGASLPASHAPKALIAIENDGSLAWEGDDVSIEACDSYCGIALADLDNDGDVEIVVGHLIFDHTGKIVQTLADANPSFSSWENIFPVPADLDDDGDLEVVIGRSAYHHDGSEYFNNDPIRRGMPAVADLDDDPQPEVLLFNADGIHVFEHDGTVKYTELRPTGDTPSVQNWMRPAMVHDVDGDGEPDFAASTRTQYVVYESSVTIKWMAPVLDGTGAAGSTAFDFLGDSTAEAMIADHENLLIFGEQGNVLYTSPRSSRTFYEYPVVADVDNDSSAEIVVPSHVGFDNSSAPTVQVLRDKDDRWIQARRIWNQHAYHVTNVREDGTIPQDEKPSWTELNTFRTQAQIGAGGVCIPPAG
jgi:hypothetical protein